MPQWLTSEQAALYGTLCSAFQDCCCILYSWAYDRSVMLWNGCEVYCLIFFFLVGLFSGCTGWMGGVPDLSKELSSKTELPVFRIPPHPAVHEQAVWGGTILSLLCPWSHAQLHRTQRRRELHRLWNRPYYSLLPKQSTTGAAAAAVGC